MEGIGESTLRAKYLDWCSARLAERFLDLSPEEIYALARPDEPVHAEASGRADEDTGAVAELTADEPAEAVAAPPSLPGPTEEGYRALVQRVTEALLRRTSLPTFEQWTEAYAESPDRFDAELLGFWKDVVGEDADEDAADGSDGDAS